MVEGEIGDLARYEAEALALAGAVDRPEQDRGSTAAEGRNGDALAVGRDADAGQDHVDSRSTLPIGYSSRIFSPTFRTTAISEPSGDQSAKRTSSSRGRGCPPLSEARASVPRPSGVNGPSSSGDRLWKRESNLRRGCRGAEPPGCRESDKDLRLLAVPIGGIDDVLFVGSETGGGDVSLSERQPLKLGRAGRATFSEKEPGREQQQCRCDADRGKQVFVARVRRGDLRNRGMRGRELPCGA